MKRRLPATENYVTAMVAFPVTVPIDGAVSKLNSIFRGFTFNKDDSDRYDEVPAYIAKAGGVTFTLFGIPEGAVSDACVLELSAETMLPIELFSKSIPASVGRLLFEKEVNSRGYEDYSNELARVLELEGINHCETIQ